MKEFIINLVKKISNVLLVVSILAAVAGLTLSFLPEIVETLGINISQENLAWLTGSLTAIAGAGSVVKYTNTALRTLTATNKSEMELKLARQKELHELEINQIKESRSEDLQFFTETTNELIDEIKLSRKENQKILELNMITAKRNINSNLVSDEDKQLYINFVKNYDNKNETNLENVYLTITSTIEKVEEKIDKPVKRDLISDALAEDGE